MQDRARYSDIYRRNKILSESGETFLWLTEEGKMRTVQMEFLRPDEIIAERDRKSIIYLPVDPMEWNDPATQPMSLEIS